MPWLLFENKKSLKIKVKKFKKKNLTRQDSNRDHFGKILAVQRSNHSAIEIYYSQDSVNVIYKPLMYF